MTHKDDRHGTGSETAPGVRPRSGIAITAGVLACLGAAHRLLSGIGAVAAYAYLNTESDRGAIDFGPTRTILAISIPIWLVIGVTLLAGGIQLFRRRPSAHWLIITGCAIDIAYVVIEYAAVHTWAASYENAIVVGGPGLILVGVAFPVATIILTLNNSTGLWISGTAPTAAPILATMRNSFTAQPRTGDAAGPVSTEASPQPARGAAPPPITGPPAQPNPHTLPMRAVDPSTIGPYTLIGRLDSDSVGDLYLGRAADMTNVVVRTVHPHHVTGTGDRAELARVFAAATTVHSDFTPVVIDADADADAALPWVATEHIPGPTLEEVVAEYGPLPAPAVENIATGLAHALSALHAAGLVHGAVSPSSVILTETGPRLAGFGISTPTAVPSVFAAPEQLAGEPGGNASDLYCLGCVLAYALTGRAPYGDANTANQLHRMTTQAPDLTGIPETRIRFVITGCLARQPDVRLTPTQILGHLEPRAAAPQSTGRPAERGRLAAPYAAFHRHHHYRVRTRASASGRSRDWVCSRSGRLSA